VATPSSSLVATHCSALGRAAMSNWALATALPT
jgi:hypothetical protein